MMVWQTKNVLSATRENVRPDMWSKTQISKAGTINRIIDKMIDKFHKND